MLPHKSAFPSAEGSHNPVFMISHAVSPKIIVVPPVQKRSWSWWTFNILNTHPDSTSYIFKLHASWLPVVRNQYKIPSCPQCKNWNTCALEPLNQTQKRGQIQRTWSCQVKKSISEVLRIYKLHQLVLNWTGSEDAEHPKTLTHVYLVSTLMVSFKISLYLVRVLFGLGFFGGFF